jgi:N-acetylmuramoyl-L-alanine amidase
MGGNSMIVGINCGHTVSGTVGCGAVGYIDESNETRAVGYKLMEKLRDNGVDVIDCTDDYNATVSGNLSAIVAKANAQPLDLFVSIHFNSGGGKGCEVYTYNGEEFEQAKLACENMSELGFVNRGIKNGSNLYVIRKSDARAMLVEVCFVDTKSDVDLYQSVGANAIADALCDAIMGKKMEEELTMSQYEELKAAIEEQNARIDVLNNELYKAENPMIYNYIDENMPEWARESVSWCVENGIIVGTGDGLGLDYTKLWTCTVIYRLAQKLK